MIFGLDFFLTMFVLCYLLIGILSIIVGIKKIKEYKRMMKKSKLIIIQGGKQERGPYGKSR